MAEEKKESCSLCQSLFPLQIRCFPPAVDRGKDPTRGVWTGRHPRKAQRGCEASWGHTPRRATHHARNGQGTCHLRGEPSRAQRGSSLGPHRCLSQAGKGVSHPGGGARPRRNAQGAITITTLGGRGVLGRRWGATLEAKQSSDP